MKRDCKTFIKGWKKKKLREIRLTRSGNLAQLAREREAAEAAKVRAMSVMFAGRNSDVRERRRALNRNPHDCSVGLDTQEAQRLEDAAYMGSWKTLEEEEEEERLRAETEAREQLEKVVAEQASANP